MERIETERLLIREWQKSDAPGLFAICQDPQLRRSGIGFFTSVEECSRILDIWIENKEMRAVCRKEDSLLIGIIGLNDMDRYEGYKELEYVIAAEYRNRGYASEAVRGMLDCGFRILGLSVIAAWVHASNPISAHVLETCGFSLEGRLRRHARDKGDTLCYSILREEYGNL